MEMGNCVSASVQVKLKCVAVDLVMVSPRGDTVFIVVSAFARIPPFRGSP